MLSRIMIVTASVLVLIGLATASGTAKTKTVHDGVDRSAAVDIRRVKVGYAKRVVHARVFSVLSSDQPICVAMLYGKPKARVHYSARGCISITGHRSKRLLKVTPHGSKRIRCRGMRVRWRQNTEGMITKVTVPRRCSKRMGRHRSQFKIFSYSGGNPSDHTGRFKVRRG